MNKKDKKNKDISWVEELGILYGIRQQLYLVDLPVSAAHTKRIKYLEKILNATEVK